MEGKWNNPVKQWTMKLQELVTPGVKECVFYMRNGGLESVS